MIRVQLPYLAQFAYDELGVIEWTNVLIALAVDDSHSLEAHSLHRGLGRKKKSVVEIIEELLAAGERRRERGGERRREREHFNVQV